MSTPKQTNKRSYTEPEGMQSASAHSKRTKIIPEEERSGSKQTPSARSESESEDDKPIALPFTTSEEDDSDQEDEDEPEVRASGNGLHGVD